MCRRQIRDGRQVTRVPAAVSEALVLLWRGGDLVPRTRRDAAALGGVAALGAREVGQAR